MKLVIVRHADAGDAEAFAKTGKPDTLRPLSPKGRKQMKEAAEGLRSLVADCDVIATSPLTRAVQTAAIVAKSYEDATETTTDTLVPGTHPEEFERWLASQGSAEVVMAVGHEPHLGQLATWLMTGQIESRIEFRKGGACLLEFEDDVKHGEATLRWLMGPKELAALA